MPQDEMQMNGCPTRSSYPLLDRVLEKHVETLFLGRLAHFLINGTRRSGNSTDWRYELPISKMAIFN